jgi:RNA polymerase sigma-70 factor (ECF subfamily)
MKENISMHTVENSDSNLTVSPKQPQYGIFEKEIMPHMAALYNFALRMTNDSDDAKDLVQETYMRAYRYLDKFEPGTNAEAWLFRIMKNTYINRFRKESKEPAKINYDDVKDIYASIKDSAVDTNDLQEKIFGNLLEDEVATALQELPEEFRRIVILYDIEGYTYEKIGDFIEIPTGTVRSRLHRGRRKLRSILRNCAVTHGFNNGKNETIDLHTSPVSRARAKANVSEQCALQNDGS